MEIFFAYNTDKPELFTEILQKSAGFANTSFLFCGDWNVVQNKSDDTYNVLFIHRITSSPRIK
jgi:hypothetical protein